MNNVKKDKLVCPDCGADMVLREGKYGRFYGCIHYPQCEGAHGIHQTTGELLGIPANKETRKMRIKTHKAFDELWKNAPKEEQRNRRKEAYELLRRHMKMTKNECHIGNFTIEQCTEVIKICTIIIEQ